jgi:hypothetical protein
LSFQKKSSVQVEHVIGSGDSSEKANIAVHDAPIAEDPHRPRRDPRPPKRLIEEANIVAYALSVADEIEGNACFNLIVIMVIFLECLIAFEHTF